MLLYKLYNVTNILWRWTNHTKMHGVINSTFPHSIVTNRKFQEIPMKVVMKNMNERCELYFCISNWYCITTISMSEVFIMVNVAQGECCMGWMLHGVNVRVNFPLTNRYPDCHWFTSSYLWKTIRRLKIINIRIS